MSMEKVILHKFTMFQVMIYLPYKSEILEASLQCNPNQTTFQLQNFMPLNASLVRLLTPKLHTIDGPSLVSMAKKLSNCKRRLFTSAIPSIVYCHHCRPQLEVSWMHYMATITATFTCTQSFELRKLFNHSSTMSFHTCFCILCTTIVHLFFRSACNTKSTRRIVE
jgi:hypothetical protein